MPHHAYSLKHDVSLFSSLLVTTLVPQIIVCVKTKLYIQTSFLYCSLTQGSRISCPWWCSWGSFLSETCQVWMKYITLGHEFCALSCNFRSYNQIIHMFLFSVSLNFVFPFLFLFKKIYIYFGAEILIEMLSLPSLFFTLFLNCWINVAGLGENWILTWLSCFLQCLWGIAYGSVFSDEVEILLLDNKMQKFVHES